MTDKGGSVLGGAPQVNLSSFNIPIPKFSGKREDFRIYAERLISSMEANNITDEKRITHTLISTMGDELYKLAHDLFAPVQVSTLKCREIIDRLTQHLNPPPNVITARCSFNRLIQRPEDSINSFVANLRRIAENCNYGAHLNMWLRDRLVAGIHSEASRRRLLQEGADLTFDRAHQLALAMESAAKEAKTLQQVSTGAAVHRINFSRDHNFQKKSTVDQGHNYRGSGCKPCSRCNSTAHIPPNCPYKEAICNFCKKQGHIQRACRSRRQNGNQSTTNAKKGYNGKSSNLPRKFTHLVEEATSASVEYEDLFMLSSHSQVNSIQKLRKSLRVDGEEIDFEIDTGSSVTLINTELCSSLFSGRPLLPSKCKLFAYNGQNIMVKGELQVEVNLTDRKLQLTLIVVDGKGPALVGRDWLQYIEPFQDMFTNSVSESTATDELLDEFKEVFDEKLGHLKEFKVSLAVQEDAIPVFRKARSVPLALRQKVEEEIDRMEALGILERVKYSQWATPVVPIVKPSGEIRLCGDYKVSVNLVAKTDIHPIPKVEELLADLSGGEEFTKLDLRHAYQQLELDDESKKLTTINTSKGLYQYTRLPYGVSAAPAVFQRTIEMVLKGIQGTVVFMDDICVTGRNRREHERNLRQVLISLKEAGLKLRREKCKFFLPMVEFLGFKIDKKGVHPTNSKVRAIQEAPSPQNISELRSYLGMLNHYSKFLPNVASTCAPLYELLKKDVQWRWTAVEQNAFENSRSHLTSDKLLVHYDSEKELVLSCDASPYGVGAVLQHRCSEGEKPIAYASRKLSSAERNYSQLEKEGLALIFGVTKFRQFLLGRTFTLVTDHRPLVSLFSPSKETPEMAASRIKRWCLKLATFKYKIEYRTSKQNSNADGLSRLPMTESEGMDECTEPDAELVLLTNKMDADLPVTAQAITKETEKDPVLCRVKQLIADGWPDEAGFVKEELRPYFQRRFELSMEQGVVMWKSRVIIPSVYREMMLEELHNEHSGIVRMKSVARGILWWPNLDRDIEIMSQSCVDCQEHSNHPVAIAPTPWKWPSSPWMRLHIDFAGPFQGYSFLVVVDAHSKWMDVIKLTSTTTEITIKHLRRLFANFGLPVHIVSDNGSQFTSSEFQQFLKRNNIRHTRTAPAHPATNGQAERTVESFKLALKKMKNQHGDIEDKLQRFLFTYRTTPHPATGKSPAELLMHRVLRTRLTCLRPSLEEKLMDKEDPNEKSNRFFNVGQSVFARNYGLYGGRWLPGVILERHGNRNYEVSVGDQTWRRHVDQLRFRHCAGHSNSVLEPVLPDGVNDSTVGSRETEIRAQTPFSAEQSSPSASQDPHVSEELPKVPNPAVPRRNPPRTKKRPSRYDD